jgi:hypothetical protein
MHNYFTIETEAEARRQEFARMAAADTRASQAMPARRGWPRFGRAAASASARSLPVMPLGGLLELRRVPRPVAC